MLRTLRGNLLRHPGVVRACLGTRVLSSATPKFMGECYEPGEALDEKTGIVQFSAPKPSAPSTPRIQSDTVTTALIVGGSAAFATSLVAISQAEGTPTAPLILAAIGSSAVAFGLYQKLEHKKNKNSSGAVNNTQEPISSQELDEDEDKPDFPSFPFPRFLRPPWANKQDSGRFTMKLLNDDRSLVSTVRRLASVSNQSKGFMAHADDKLKAVIKELQSKEKDDRSKDKESKEKVWGDMVRKDLASGMSSKRLFQKWSPRVFVFDFNPTIMGGDDPQERVKMKQFREFVSLMVAVCSPYDEVVIRLTSPGGGVQFYGLGAAQILRLRKAGVRTTVAEKLEYVWDGTGDVNKFWCVDQVIASPFATLGSIGVVTEFPNFNKWLNKHEINWVEVTAGQHKRTVGPFSELTEEKQKKTQADLQRVHTAFKDFVRHFRGANLDIEEVSTGEWWLANEAVSKGLVDRIMTSDEYIRSKMRTRFIKASETTGSSISAASSSSQTSSGSESDTDIIPRSDVILVSPGRRVPGLASLLQMRMAKGAQLMVERVSRATLSRLGVGSGVMGSAGASGSPHNLNMAMQHTVPQARL